jgi:hypothetical protein
LECKLDSAEIWGNLKGKHYLLAVITPCKTDGKDATKVVTEYTVSTATIVTDLQAVQCAIGRVQRQKTWGIIDRSMDEARPEFVSSVEGKIKNHGPEEDNDDSEEFFF